MSTRPEGRGRVETVRDGIARAPEMLDDWRARVRAVDAAMEAFEYDRRRVGALLAGSLAFRLFRWLLPVGLLLIALAGFAAAGRSADDIGERLGLTGYVTGVIADTGRNAEDGRWLTVLVALIALHSAGSSAARALRAVHLLAWELEPSRVQRRWAASLGFTGFTLLAVAVNTGAAAARRADADLGLTVTMLGALAFFVLWLAASRLLPHRDVGWRGLVPGALLVAVGTQAMHLVTVFYLAHKLERSSELYGSLGTASALLLGLYLLGRLLVAAPMFNATLDRRRARSRADTAVDVTRSG